MKLLYDNKKAVNAIADLCSKDNLEISIDALHDVMDFLLSEEIEAMDMDMLSVHYMLMRCNELRKRLIDVKKAIGYGTDKKL